MDVVRVYHVSDGALLEQGGEFVRISVAELPGVIELLRQELAGHLCCQDMKFAEGVTRG